MAHCAHVLRVGRQSGVKLRIAARISRALAHGAAEEGRCLLLTIGSGGKRQRPCYLFFCCFFLGLSSLGGAGVSSIFLTASSNVVGGRMIGLPRRPVGLGACFIERHSTIHNQTAHRTFSSTPPYRQTRRASSHPRALSGTS